ncbi:VanZ family protein [Bizionia myxarmorum]|uniref:VanZ-like domain-containing protein n=1 Tax=Bizionia myxarmorum TaxID=291186 RepID=A0A5D0RBD6_9FLAO|nr:VanZ family protein [Bizionia myxarmorum]TYB78399.1 hypothetical protein ES674_01045 [Bizionia myxarmorum]
MLKRNTLLISIVYTLSLLTVSLIKLDFSKIDSLAPSFGDKIFHFGAYSVLTLVWYFTMNIQFNYSKMKALSIVVVSCITFGIIIEVLQKELTYTRFFDFYDIVANIGGVLLAAAIVLLIKKK